MIQLGEFFHFSPVYHNAIDAIHLFLKNNGLKRRTTGQNICFSTTYRIYDYLQERMKSTLR